MSSRANRGISHLINVLQLRDFHGLLNSLDHRDLPLCNNKDVDDLDAAERVRPLHNLFSNSLLRVAI